MFIWFLKLILFIMLFIVIIGTLGYIISLWFFFLDEIIEKIIEKKVRGRK